MPDNVPDVGYNTWLSHSCLSWEGSIRLKQEVFLCCCRVSCQLFYWSLVDSCHCSYKKYDSLYKTLMINKEGQSPEEYSMKLCWNFSQTMSRIILGGGVTSIETCRPTRFATLKKMGKRVFFVTNRHVTCILRSGCQKPERREKRYQNYYNTQT